MIMVAKIGRDGGAQDKTTKPPTDTFIVIPRKRKDATAATTSSRTNHLTIKHLLRFLIHKMDGWETRAKGGLCQKGHKGEIFLLREF